MKKTVVLGLILAASAVGLFAACGGSTNSSGGGATTAADLQTFDTTSQSLSQAVAGYRTRSAAIADPASCAAAQQSYAPAVQPLVDRMQQMAGSLDGEMSSLGRTGDADMACATGAMKVELDHHAAAACASADPAADRAEAVRHADAMDGIIGHQRDRAGEMASVMGVDGGMMGAGMEGGHMADGGWTLPDGGSVAACQGSSDGGYTWDGGPMTDGGTTDGGMMGGG